ncbi:MAG: MerR family transcriptional regulator [Defluviitaleaceae bacterium]|nr:MerR family transcriptional regulator [Defluviitaleaceae bacterium]
MDKFRAIPEGYMRVGEMAKAAGVTVRTLQYYDKEGLLTPSAESEGGFRLYTDKDMVKLIRILTLKELGFSLSQIKERIPSLDTPKDVINALTEQAAEIRGEIAVLSESLDAIENLKEEVSQMDTVDFQKYSSILVNLQMKNKHYWMIKHIDNDVIVQIGNHLKSIEKAQEMMGVFNSLSDEAMELFKADIDPNDDRSQNLAKRIWDMMLELTGGDMDLMTQLSEQVNGVKANDKNWTATSSFMEKSMEIYLSNIKEE